jgi:hypothetical protein
MGGYLVLHPPSRSVVAALRPAAACPCRVDQIGRVHRDWGLGPTSVAIERALHLQATSPGDHGAGLVSRQLAGRHL